MRCWSICCEPHDQIAEPLVSDEVNVFTVARYLRLTADAAIGKTAITPPQTDARFPGTGVGIYVAGMERSPVTRLGRFRVRCLYGHEERRGILMRRLTPSMILALLLAACNGAEGKMRSADAVIRNAIVTIDMPDDLESDGISGGLAIRRTGAEQGRRLYDMTLTAAGGASPVPLDRVLGTGADAISYGLTQETGGSGGDDVTLIPERHCGTLPLRLRLDTQADEGATFDPAPILAMLASARCSPSAGGTSGAG